MTDEYICLIFAAHREPQKVEVVSAENDQGAIAQALKLMHGSQAHGYELWLRGKKIASFFAPSAIRDAVVGKSPDR